MPAAHLSLKLTQPSPISLALYANGMPTLLFQTARGFIKGQTNHLTLFGQTVFPDTITIENDFTLIAYFFKPYAIHALFGIPSQELTDKPTSLELLLQTTRAKALQEQLLNAIDVSEMISLLDEYILHLIAKVKADHRLIEYAVEKITNCFGKGALRSVQREMYLTERSFQRLFEKNIGMSPNLYRRVAQFNAAFEMLNSRQFDKLSDIAFRHGYADQSHYIRSFKEFTNISPKEYLKFSEG